MIRSVRIIEKLDSLGSTWEVEINGVLSGTYDHLSGKDLVGSLAIAITFEEALHATIEDYVP